MCGGAFKSSHHHAMSATTQRRASNVEAVRHASSPLLRRILNDSLETLADKVFHYKSPRKRVDIACATGGEGGRAASRHPRGLGRGGWGPFLSLPLTPCSTSILH